MDKDGPLLLTLGGRGYAYAYSGCWISSMSVSGSVLLSGRSRVAVRHRCMASDICSSPLLPSFCLRNNTSAALRCLSCLTGGIYKAWTVLHRISVGLSFAEGFSLDDFGLPKATCRRTLPGQKARLVSKPVYGTRQRTCPRLSGIGYSQEALAIAKALSNCILQRAAGNPKRHK